MNNQERNVFLRQQKYKANPRHCNQCELALPYDKKNLSFCNRSCAATYNNLKRAEHGWHLSIEVKQKISQSVQRTQRERNLTPPNNKGKQIVKREVRVCGECKIDFMVIPSSAHKYCSLGCSSKHRGGYRNHSGRSKSGYYKGIYCGSTYELAWVIYNLDHHTPFARFSKALKKDGLTYIPDFIIDNKIIEIKGYFTDKVFSKTELAKQLGYEIEVLYRKDIQHCFDWVKTQYGITSDTKIISLYDMYKPSYEYICANCNNHFGRDVVSNRLVRYCSRKCASLGNKK